MKKAPHRFKRRRGFNGTYVDGDFPYFKHMASYVMRLLRSYGLIEQVMAFILSCMPIKERQRMVRSFYLGKSGKEDRTDADWNFNRVMNRLQRPGNVSDDIVEDVVNGRTAMGEMAICRALAAWLKSAVAAFGGSDGDCLNARSDELKRTFGLAGRDITLLLFLCCTYATNMEFLKNIQEDMTFTGFLRFIAVATGLPYGIVKCRLGWNGRLIKTGIIEEMDTVRPSFFTLNGSIADFLAGLSDRSLIEQCIRVDAGRVFDLRSFGIEPESVRIMRDLLATDSPVNILLHGTAGTGKTEFARAVASSTGKKVYFLNHRPRHDRKGGGDEDPVLILNVAGNSVPAGQGIIVVDEADYILNTVDRFSVFGDTVEKGVLNSFLDRSRSQMIWISNRVNNMEESTLRRFSYSLHFRPYTARERENIWNAILKGHPLRPYVGQDVVRKLSLEYRVNAGSIASALEAVAMMFRGRKRSADAIAASLRRLLDRHQEMIHRDFGRRKKLHDLTDLYDVTTLNLDTDTGRIVSSVTGFADEWKNAVDERDANLNLLFWGPPGTGKTEFVKYLGERAGLKVIVKRYSDLESMWVGESEKGIAAAFREAEESRAILFIDEADSFFTSRATAQRSWEVSRTNEFLTQMENHRGIFICCTNLLPSMDSAAMRRFHMKAEFRPLADDGKERLYRAYFPGKGETLTAGQLKEIRAIAGLTPGDFKAVRQKIRYAADKMMGHDMIIVELKKEVGYRKGIVERVTGFHTS